MNVLDQVRQPLERVDQIVAEPYRMRRGKTKALQALDFVHGLEQLKKRTFAFPLRKLVAAGQLHDLPKQSDFLHSVPNQIAHFVDDFIDGTASLPAARLRNNAEGAMHIASLHNRNESGRLPGHELLIANRR